MSDFHAEASRGLQDRFDARRLADALGRLVHDALSPDDAEVVTAADMSFLATVDSEGRPSCSDKGGAPGFVQALGPRRLAFPSYDGNGMFLSMGNVAATGHVGLRFIDFERQTRLRVNGIATLSDDPDDPCGRPGPRRNSSSGSRPARAIPCAIPAGRSVAGE